MRSEALAGVEPGPMSGEGHTAGAPMVSNVAVQGDMGVDRAEVDGPAGGRAVELLFEECGAQAYALARRLLGTNRPGAEDVVQVAFAEVSGLLTEMTSPDAAALQRITLQRVRQLCMDRLRHPGEPARARSAWATEGETRAPRGVSGAATPEMVRTALASLPAEQRRVVEAAYFDGQTSAEIATRTGDTALEVNRLLRLGLQGLAVTLSGGRTA